MPEVTPAVDPLHLRLQRDDLDALDLSAQTAPAFEAAETEMARRVESGELRVLDPVGRAAGAPPSGDRCCAAAGVVLLGGRAAGSVAEEEL